MTDGGQPTVANVLRIADLAKGAANSLLDRFGLSLEQVEQHSAIPASFWGDEEAGVRGLEVYVRADTPVHSLLHEMCHVICMDRERRGELDRDAGGNDLEESAVCYLQIILADYLPGVGRERLMADMDTWGYSFRLGKTKDWFVSDAEDARLWLLRHELINEACEPRWCLRID